MTEKPEQSVGSPFNCRNTQDSFPFHKLTSLTAWIYCCLRLCPEGPGVRSMKVTYCIIFKPLNRIKMWSSNPFPSFFSFLGRLKPLWSLWFVIEFVWTCPKRSWSSWPSVVLSSHTSHTPSPVLLLLVAEMNESSSRGAQQIWLSASLGEGLSLFFPFV